MKRLAHLDSQIFQWIAQYTHSADHFVAKLFKWISKTGDGHLYLAIGAILFYFDDQHGALFFYTAFAAYCFEVPMYIALKHAIKRKRPCDLLLNFNAHVVPADKFSLPSGHTAAAFLMATVVMHFYPSLSILAYTWASLIGLSRIVLRVHFPLDVLIGASLGIGVAFSSIYLLG